MTNRFGPFNAAARYLFVPLLRTIHLTLFRPRSLWDFPSCLIANSDRREYEFRISEIAEDSLLPIQEFLSLRSDALLARVSELTSPNPPLLDFERVFWEDTLEELQNFYDKSRADQPGGVPRFRA